MRSNHPETDLIRTQTERSQNREHSAPIYMTSSFVFDSAEHARAVFAREMQGNSYGRATAPNAEELVKKICLLEGADDGIATATGMSAILATMMSILEAGDHVLASRAVFGSTHQMLTKILPRFGISHSYAQPTKPEQWEALIQTNTKICLVETPSNPALEIIDLRWLGELCNKHGVLMVVDNAFATPLVQAPIPLGASVVIHSATKFIDGQGRGLGGVVVAKQEIADELRFFNRHAGPIMSPFNAWMFSKSLETLPVRMERHCDNALMLARWLETREEVASVRYPYLPSHPQHEIAKRQMCKGGALVTFELVGGLDAGRRFLNGLEMVSLTANLGDSRTTATHPASTTHSSLSDEERDEVGISAGLVRVSVGLEHVGDVQADFERGMKRIINSQ